MSLTTIEFQHRKFFERIDTTVTVAKNIWIYKLSSQAKYPETCVGYTLCPVENHSIVQYGIKGHL